MQPPQFNLADLKDLATVEGKQRLLDVIQEYRDEYGPEWLAQIRDEMPGVSWVVELVVTKTADEAHSEVVKHYPLAVFAAPQLKAFHGWLLEEIDKKR